MTLAYLPLCRIQAGNATAQYNSELCEAFNHPQGLPSYIVKTVEDKLKLSEVYFKVSTVLYSRTVYVFHDRAVVRSGAELSLLCLWVCLLFLLSGSVSDELRYFVTQIYSPN